jgi:NADPH2:quinone reductase
LRCLAGRAEPCRRSILIQLSGKGSLFVTRPTLWHYIATRAELELARGRVLGWAASGQLKLRTEHIYPLAEAAQAQTELEVAEYDGQDFAGAVKTVVSGQ